MIRVVSFMLIIMMLLTFVGSVAGVERPKIFEIIITCNGKTHRVAEEREKVFVECSEDFLSISMLIKCKDEFIIKASAQHIIIKESHGAYLSRKDSTIYYVKPLTREDLISITMTLVSIEERFLSIFTKDLEIVLEVLTKRKQNEPQEPDLEALVEYIMEKLERVELPLSAKLEYKSRLLDIIIKKDVKEAQKLLASIISEERTFQNLKNEVTELYRKLYGMINERPREKISEAFEKLQKAEGKLYGREYNETKILIAEVRRILEPSTLEVVLEVVEKIMPFLLMITIILLLAVIFVALRKRFTKSSKSSKRVEGTIPENLPWIYSIASLTLIQTRLEAFKDLEGFLEEIVKLIGKTYSMLYNLSNDVLKSINPYTTPALIEATTILLIATLTALITGISRRLTAILLTLAWIIVLLCLLLL